MDATVKIMCNYAASAANVNRTLLGQTFEKESKISCSTNLWNVKKTNLGKVHIFPNIWETKHEIVTFDWPFALLGLTWRLIKIFRQIQWPSFNVFYNAKTHVVYNAQSTWKTCILMRWRVLAVFSKWFPNVPPPQTKTK